jgi:hypothetical protein
MEKKYQMNGRQHSSSSIHKEGNKKNPNNYKSVTSTMSKLYDRILSDLIEAIYQENEEE